MTKLGDLIDLHVNYPEADFWIERRGSAETVGKPSRSFLEHGIGIKVRDTETLLPGYLYYVMEHLWMQGVWKKKAKGTTNLVNIRTSDVADIEIANSNPALREAVSSVRKRFA